MTTRSPLFWLRWVTVALIVALCMSDLVSHADSYSRLHATLRSLVYIAYACLFLRNTAAFPRPDASGIWILVAQIATSTPLESNLSVVTAATIPLVLEKGRWRVWVSVTLSLVALQMVVRSGVYLYIRRAQLPADVTPVAVAITLLSGLLEVLAWHVFAFLASVMIVKFDEDRRRLTLLNAEMEGAQVLLMESGRLAERLRISRELHDALGHHLTCLSLQLEVAEHLPDDQVRSKLAEARFLARLLIAEIREAVSQWRLETSPALPIALRSLSRGMPGLVVKFE
ncbi:MAG: hypothetical protein H7Y20_02840, partial [Bryobacteraceae bacterium]|nr:hypothetical protein [Bryobacteraceae bacterium]